MSEQIPAPGQQQEQNPHNQGWLDKAREAGDARREETREKREHRKERRAAAKEKVKQAWTKTKDVSRTISDVVRGLATDKDVRGALQGAVESSTINAQQKYKDFDKKFDTGREKLVDSYDAIVDKAALAKEAALANAKDNISELAQKTKEKLVTEPANDIKALGKDVANYFINKGKNFADRIRARQADADADYYQQKANKFEKKANKRDTKLEKIAAKINAAEEAGRSNKVNRLERKYSMAEGKSADVKYISQAYKGSADLAREKATALRTTIAGRK